MSVTYDAVGDFSIVNGNPNGVWSYGASTGAMTDPGSTSEVDFWSTFDGSAFLYKNVTAAPVNAGSIVLPVDHLGLDGLAAAFTSVTFTAPTTGTYVVSGSFLGINTSQAATNAIVASSSGFLFSQVIDAFDESISFNVTLKLTAGDTVQFQNFNNFVGNTELGLAATVVRSQRFAWKAAVSGDWDIAANWKPASVPEELDVAVIGVAGTYTVTSQVDRSLLRLSLTAADATLAITGSTFSTMALINRGSIAVGDGATDAILVVEGIVDNSGSVAVTSGLVTVAGLEIGAAGATLLGGGTIELAGDGSFITGATADAALDNRNNTIRGAGLVGDGMLELFNRANGVIDADSGGVLAVDTGINAIDNRGTLRATNGTLLIESDVFSSDGSIIEAVGPGEVVLDNIVLIGVTTLQTSAGGVISVAAGLTEIEGTAHIQGDVAVDAAANGADTALMFVGTVNNAGTVTVTGGIDGLTDLIAEFQVCDGTVRLTGTGSVSLGGTGGNAAIVGAFPDSKLINVSNNIVGAGAVGDDTMDIVNQAAGVISATIAGEMLVIDTANHTLSNFGELSAENGAILLLTGNVNCSGASAEICAEGTGSTVILDDVGVIGTFMLHADPDASVQIAAGASFLAGNVTLAGTIDVDAVANGDVTDLLLGGTITNTGTIRLTGEEHDEFTVDPIVAAMGIVGGVTLQGGGSIVISGGGPFNGIFDTGFDSRLINVDNTIEGAGNLMTNLDNKVGGLVDANVTGEFLALQSTRNAGTVQASNGGILAISSFFLSDPGSVVKATGAGSQVVLAGGFLSGSLHLVGEDGGTFAAVGPNFAFNGFTLDGDLSLDAALYEDFVVMIFEKTLVNNGTITIAGNVHDDGCGCPDDTAELLVDARGGSLAGGGTITLGGDAGLAFIADSAGEARLVNIDNTIQGAGTVGGNLILVNQTAGMIEANVAGQTLALGGGASPIVNRGTLKASNDGTLSVLNDVARRGAAVIEGGTIEFQAGSLSAVSFMSGTGTLELDNADAFAGTVAGFADSEDYDMLLRDIDFDSIVTTSYISNTGNTKGLLTISDGVDTASIRLFGAFANDFSVGPPPIGFTGFVLSDDGTNGTTVNYVTA
jgi:hypothetical protein